VGSVVTPFGRKNINDGFGHDSGEDTKKAPHEAGLSLRDLIGGGK
jgi:hypothetical protein